MVGNVNPLIPIACSLSKYFPRPIHSKEEKSLKQNEIRGFEMVTLYHPLQYHPENPRDYPYKKGLVERVLIF